MCAEANGKTLVETNRDLFTHRRQTMYDWDLVYTRVVKSSAVKISGEENL